MKKSFKKIGISGPIKNKKDESFIRGVVDCLSKQGIEILSEKSLMENSDYLNQFSVKDDEFIKRIDLLISVGGDGTMLRNARKFGKNKIPILGINLGTLGFLTDIQTDDPLSRLELPQLDAEAT